MIHITDHPGSGTNPNLNAITDLLILLVVFWGLWSLRFQGVTFVGAQTMGACILLVLALQKWRNKPLGELGIYRVESKRLLASQVGMAAAAIGLTMVVVGAFASVLMGGPSESAAITQQPQELWLFLLDVTVITWVLIGFGEEFVFRGFILNRLLVLTGESKMGLILASGLQAIWFGAAHASQGLTGMVITGAIGFALAWVFLNRTSRNLWPLVIAHGAIDFVVLTMTWISRQ